MKILLSLIIALATTAVAFAQEETPAFKFSRGQKVHITALKNNGAPDITVESRVREEFEKQKFFTVTDKLKSADFVFMIAVEYQYTQLVIGTVGRGGEEVKSAVAFVYPPDILNSPKDDYETLSEKALWRFGKPANQWSFASLSKQIVKKFHEFVKKQP